MYSQHPDANVLCLNSGNVHYLKEGFFSPVMNCFERFLLSERFYLNLTNVVGIGYNKNKGLFHG